MVLSCADVTSDNKAIIADIRVKLRRARRAAIKINIKIWIIMNILDMMYEKRILKINNEKRKNEKVKNDIKKIKHLPKIHNTPNLHKQVREQKHLLRKVTNYIIRSRKEK